MGHFGEFHPIALETLDVSGPLCGFEIFLDTIPAPRKKANRSKGALAVSQLQAVRRDFAFIVDTNIEAATLLRAAQGADKKLISDVKIFDLFEGASLGEGKKSLAIEVTLQPTQNSLTDEDIEAVASKVVANVTQSTGGTLRGA